MYRPTSWEVKETLDREERDDVVIKQFCQSQVDKMMSIIKAEAVYEEPFEAPPDTHSDEDLYDEQEMYYDIHEEEYHDIGVECETYEDTAVYMMSPPRYDQTKDEKANVFPTNTKVCISYRIMLW